MINRLPIWTKWLLGVLMLVALVAAPVLISPKATLDRITTCATVFTFIAIAWQSNETRKQAAIANKTLIAQFRPRVIVRDIRLLQEDADWKIIMYFENLGATNATVKHTTFQIGWKSSNARYDPLHQQSIDEFPLDAGGELQRVTTITDRTRFNSK